MTDQKIWSKNLTQGKFTTKKVSDKIPLPVIHLKEQFWKEEISQSEKN